MPTPAEQKALAFVAMVVLLGGAVRVVRGGILNRPAPTATEQQALAQQAYSANSSAVSRTTDRAAKSRKRRIVAREVRDSGATRLGAGASGDHLDARGFPPPSRRIDVGAPPVPLVSGPMLQSRAAAVSRAGPIDLDTATEAEIEALPRVGPALAHRIVAYRDSAGPLGGLETLRRVRGVGAATVELLAPLVTFSGQARR
ncbi:MAG: ComEA family DNA-binding protein [Gemmatimonadaceae bacterium]